MPTRSKKAKKSADNSEVPTSTEAKDALHPSKDPNASENRFSGIHPNNDYPLVDGKLDEEQERRLQARQESDFVSGARADRPDLVSRFKSNDHDARKSSASEEA